jgi:exopolysaccharide production protein ExoZ
LRVFTGIQAMRGIAALSVVCGHAVSARPDMVGPGLAKGALTILASGVDIFFVISGFIIASTAAAQRDPWNFVFRRAVRIFPVYWLVLAAALVSSSWIVLSPGERPALDFGLIFAWTYPNWYIAPAWSIAFELHFYAAVAIILAVAPSRLFELLFAGLGIVLVAVAFRLQLGIYSHPLVLEFGAGVGIAYLQRNSGLRFSRRNLVLSVVLFAAGWYWIFLHGSPDPHLARVATYGLASALLIHAVVAAEIEGKSFSPILQWLGEISYALYVVHYLVVYWIASFTGLWLLSTPGTIMASIVLSIGLAWALHVTIEAPLIRWGRNWSPMRRGQQPSDVLDRATTERNSARAE